MTILKKRRGGFTLVELLVTAVIISVLALGAFPAAELSIRRSKEYELRRNLVLIRNALDAYKKAYEEGRVTPLEGASGYPPSLEALTDGVIDAKSKTGERMFFLRRLPRDPFFAGAGGPPASTWGKRSYSSTARDPKEGKDVFDVYSLNNGVGINGVPYREW